jgi:microcin C transport system substrate-binding protein
MKLKFVFLATAFIGLSAGAGSKPGGVFSSKAGEEYRKLPEAGKKGTLYLTMLGNPRVLVPTLAEDVPSRNTVDYLFAQLMRKDSETGEYFPMIAEKVEVSKDRKLYTFTIRKDAVWEDGTPVTPEDAEFTFNTIMNPKVQAASLRSYFEGMRLEKIDARSFRFSVEKPNVNTLASILDDFLIIQKKQFSAVPDFNKAKGVMEPVTSGPYRLKAFNRDQRVELELKKDWWGFKIPEFKNMFNFDSIVLRIISDPALAYEKFLKGDLDILEMNAETFGTKVKGVDREKFGADAEAKQAVWAKHFMTDAPAPWTYIGWNRKRPVFASKKTRQALAHLVPYDEILAKVFRGEGIRAVSPFGSRSPNAAPDQAAKAFPFDPKKALQLLKEDGWADSDQSGVLSKVIDGKNVKFEFSIQYNSENPMRSKIAQMVKEQFRKAGVQVNIQALEFNALLERMDNRDFDAVIMAWGKGMRHSDSKQIWHSKSSENKGSNFVSYSNPEVDRLIEQASVETDGAKHFKLNQKIGSLIYDDQPYAFIAEVPGFMAGFRRDKIKAKKWVMKYDDTAPTWIYSHEP